MVVIKSEFALALNQIASERGISPDDVIASIETALIAAYKKEYPEKKKEDLKAKVNKETGEAKIFDGDKDITPPGFGRIAAQTAKQVILQKIREAEKKTIISFYQSQIGSIVKGRVIRFDGFNCYLDIGKTEAILPKDEQIKNEKYQVNSTFTVYLKEIINDKFGNPRVMVSRTDSRLIEELFKREVPEIASGTVVIKKVVREPGERAKVAVYSNHRGVDSVGACVGQKGVRVQTVTNEIGGNEKIDIIQWSDDLKSFIASALSPAKIISVEIDEKKHKAKVVVEEKEAPLAIGKNGVNVNLASQLTGFEIDIIQKNIENQKEHNQTSEEKTSKQEQEK